MKKLIILVLVVAVLAASAGIFWIRQPIIAADAAPIAFTIKPGSGMVSATQQIAQAGVPVSPVLLSALIRLTGRSGKIRAGSYELKPGTTPPELIDQLVRGELAQESVTVVEGSTFRQMREKIGQHPSLRHDSANLSDQELMARIGSRYKDPEGLFFPDTYRFAKGSSDLDVYRQAHQLLMERLEEAWQKRRPGLPYRSPYDALIMASIVEKETGLESERKMIAGVFINRLERGMLLQTDPTVIYGMGERFQGNITKKDLQADNPYNTYRRAGLPPTPIALPGSAAIEAALQPAETGALYFVARGDGSSHFSSNLADHNRAVNRYQR